MLLALVLSMSLGWREFDSLARGMFTGLAVLAAYMAWRAAAVARNAPASTGLAPASPTPQLVDGIGFNVISYVVAGTIVPLIRAGAGPLWITVDVVVCVVLVRFLVHRRHETVSLS
jgi:hypothetical protein